MQKGQKSEKVKAWEELGEWFANQGASKYLNYIMNLDGEEYAKRYEAMLEYFKPKLSRSEQKHEISNDLQSAILKAFDDGEAVQPEPDAPASIVP